MGIRINRAEFLSKLELVRHGLSAKDVLEQSSSFVFRPGEVVTYNGEVYCSCPTGMNGKFTGAVRAAKFLETLAKLPEDEVDLVPKEGVVEIHGKGRRAGVKMDAQVSLPVDAVEQPKDWKELPAGFGDAMALVLDCVSDDASVLVNCVHVHPNYFEATDNDQVIRYRMKTPIPAPVLLRRDAMKPVASLGMTHFAETTDWFHFRSAQTGLQLTCRRITERFPDVGSVIKETDGEPATLPSALADAVEKAEIFSAEEKDQNYVLVEVQQGRVQVTGRGASGWYTERRPIRPEHYAGKPIQFLIPPRLLTEIVTKRNQCLLSESRLKVRGDAFVYVTILGQPGGKERNNDD